MPNDLFKFLPWSPQNNIASEQEFSDGYLLWSHVMQVFEETKRQHLDSLSFGSHDNQMRPRSLTDSDKTDIARLLSSCQAVIDNFDTAVLASALQAPKVVCPNETKNKLLNWGLCGNVSDVAHLKYLQGRYLLSESKFQSAWDCVAKLHQASLLCFKSKNSEIYMTGISFRALCQSLLYEIIENHRSENLIREAIAIVLSANEPHYFAEAFLAPVSYQAIEHLKLCSTDLPFQEALNIIVQQFVTTQDEEPEPIKQAVDLLMSSNNSILCSNGQKLHEIVKQFIVDNLMAINSQQPFRLKDTVELIETICHSCLECLTFPAVTTRKRLATLPYSFLPAMLTKNDQQCEYDLIDIENLIRCLSKIDNAVGLLFASKFAKALCTIIKNNAFFWYYELAQSRGISIALSVCAFTEIQGNRPQHVEDVVANKILTDVPVEPFSGKKFLYKKNEGIISGQAGMSELPYWAPPIDWSEKLQWHIP